MHSTFNKLLIALFAMALAGCGEETLNGESVPELIKSVDQISGVLPPDDAERFVETVNNIIIRQTTADDPYVPPLSEEQERHIKKALYVLKGKSAEDILELHDKFKGAKPRPPKKGTQAAAAPAAKPSNAPLSTAPAAPASEVSVMESNLRAVAPGTAPYSSEVQFLIKNDSPRAVSAVQLFADVSEATVKVHSEEFYHLFEPALNPGEMRMVKAALDPASYKLPTYVPGPDTVLSLRVLRSMDTAGVQF